MPHFAGKVKCIYIDPPYNTGNEKWVYNDNVNSPRIVGKTTPHLKFQVRPSIPTPRNGDANLAPNLIPFTRGGAPMEAIGFGLGERLRELLGPTGRARKDLEMIFYLEENEFMGRVTPQLVVKDFR